MQFFCQVCSKRMEMPIVLAALCIPCILNIDLCCLCINSKPEIKPYLKIHLAPGGCLCPLVCLLGQHWQSTSWLIAAPAHSLEEKNWKVQTHYSEYYGNLSCFCCRICSWQKKTNPKTSCWMNPCNGKTRLHLGAIAARLCHEAGFALAWDRDILQSESQQYRT